MRCNFSTGKLRQKGNWLLTAGMAPWARAVCTVGLIAAAFSPNANGAAINISIFEAGTYTLDGGKTFIVILDTCPRQMGVPTCTVPEAPGDSIVGFDLFIKESAQDGGGTSDVMRFRDVGGAFTFQFFSDPDQGEGPPLDMEFPTGSVNAKFADETGDDGFSYTFQTNLGNDVHVTGAPEPGTFLPLLLSLFSLALLRLRYIARYMSDRH